MTHRLIALLIIASVPLTARALTAQATTDGPSAEQMVQELATQDGDFVACDEIIVSEAAFELAKTSVAEKLWSPTSAEFPLAASRVSKHDACRFIIRSWVEAKNGFGQMVRTPYVVELENKTGDWSVLGARIGSPSYTDRLQLAAAE